MDVRGLQDAGQPELLIKKNREIGEAEADAQVLGLAT